MNYKKICSDLFEQLLLCQNSLNEELGVLSALPQANESAVDRLDDIIGEIDVDADILDAIIGSRLDDGRAVFYLHWCSWDRPIIRSDMIYQLSEADSPEKLCEAGRLIDRNMMRPVLVYAKMAEHASGEELSEMGKLAVMLNREKIPFEFSLCQNELMICSPTAENTVVDAVCNRTSQGWSSGLLEVWRQDTCDEPVGYLRAEDALKHFMNYYSGK